MDLGREAPPHRPSDDLTISEVSSDGRAVWVYDPQGMFSLRRLTVFLCLAAVLLAALSPSAPGNAACLVTVFFYFIATVVPVLFSHRNETPFLPASPLIAVLASRAPPCG